MAISVQRGLRVRARISVAEGFRAAWPLGVAAAAVWSTGRYGFSPTDDEFVLAGSWRLLQGEVPHKDFVSARPVGASILHLIDFVLPGPLFLDGRFTTALEFVLTAAALLVLAVRGIGVHRGGSLRRTACVAMGTAAVTLMNLHDFPLTPWHTVDGLACSAVGWFLVDDGLALGRPGRRRFGLFLAGFAAICKQSFAPVPLIALCMLVLRSGELRPTWRSPRGLVGDAAALVLAPVGYFVWVGAAGGLRDAVVQLTASPPVWGRETIIEPWHALLADPTAILWGTAFVAAVGLWALSRNSDQRKAESVTLASAVVISIALVGTLLGVTLSEPIGAGIIPFVGPGLEVPLESSPLLWWMCLILVVVDAAKTRRIFTPAVATCALAWMASLSWGYALPVLLQGSLVANSLILTWGRTAVPAMLSGNQNRHRSRMRQAAPVVLTALVAIASSAFVLSERATHEYRDAPRAELTADLGSAAPGGRGIRTSAATVAYMRGLSKCVGEHPATWTAILPDTAAAYPLLHLHNPFPSDWMLPQELVGDADARILATAQDLDHSGDYLVLFQDDDPLIDAIKSRLTGKAVQCGTLTGRWEPAPDAHSADSSNSASVNMPDVDDKAR